MKKIIESSNQSVYVRMMKYVSEEMRFRYASHVDAPVDLLEYLADDPARRVRYAVYENPSTPEAIREKIVM